MPEICRFYGIVIRMYFKDHAPPHFHAIYQDHEAQFDIITLNIIEGDLPKRAKLMVLEWASEHRAELLGDWEKARKPEPLAKIEPLK